MELRDKANAKKAAAKSSSIDDDDENDMARKIMSEESKVAKVKAKAVEVAKKKAEERHKIITTKIKAMHPKPLANRCRKQAVLRSILETL